MVVKLRRMLSILVMVCMVLLMLPARTWAAEVGNADDPTLAATGDDVIFSTRRVTVYRDSTVDEIIAAYGEEKLKTPSCYGGYAYTFYHDNYEDFLYVETVPSGKIAAFSVFGEFQSFVGNSGDKTSSSHSTVYDKYSDWETGTLWAVNALFYNNLSWDERKTAVELYLKDAHYGEAIAQHTALMWNGVSAYFGKKASVKFDSRTFYINRQLLENGSDLSKYCRSIGDNSFNHISTSSGLSPSTDKAQVPSPLEHASKAKSYTLPNESYIVCDHFYSDSAYGNTLGSLNPRFYEKGVRVPYTAEETARIAQMNQMYKESLAQWAAGKDTYRLEPSQSTSLPLEAGKLNQDCLESAVTFLNMIRVGAGIPEFVHSEDLSDCCQHKAVLNNYIRKTGISNPNPHQPARPDGVDEEFYSKAQFGGPENIYGASGGIVASITNALDDRAGDKITCGHRYNLLDPNYKYVGFGDDEGQCVHKLNEYQAANIDVVAWPSKGVMVTAAGGGSGQMFTVKFYAPYELTNNSGVKFKCLNTGEIITFESGMENTQAKQLYRNGAIISYCDNSIAMTAGNVYEITVTNVKNSNTGHISDYTYRSVYVSLDEVGGAAELALSADTLSIREGKTKKLNAIVFPVDVSNKMVTWSSDNKEVAVVNENGYVTAVGSGTAVITAQTDNGVQATCTVQVGAGYDESELVLERAEQTTAPYTAILTNNSGETISVNLMIAVYDGDERMLDCRNQRETVVDSDSVEISVNTPADASVVKVFVLDAASFAPLRTPFTDNKITA